jgi:hypothetical protein
MARHVAQFTRRSHFLGLAHFVHVAASERQQGDLASLLHGTGNDALMFGARTGLAARANVAFISDVFPEKVGLFVIDGKGFICTELAEFGLGEKATFAAFATGLLPFI